MKSVEYEGVVYRSLTELHRAKANRSVTYQHFYARIRKGWEIRDALNTPGDSHAVRFNGRTYRDLRALHRAAAAEGVTFNAFHKRVTDAGWSVRRALKTPMPEIAERTFTVDGRHFTSIAALARAAGITYMAAVRRCYRGFTDQEIFYGRTKSNRAKPDSVDIDGKSSKRKSTPITVNGIAYRSIYYAHKTLKPPVPIITIRARLRYGWTSEQAFGLQERVDGRRSPDKRRIVIGERRLTIKQASEEYGVTVTTIRGRLARGATSEQAVGLVPLTDLAPRGARRAVRKRESPSEPPIEVNGVAYASIGALAKAYGLKESLIRNRIVTLHMSPTEAVGKSARQQVVVDGITYRSVADAFKQLGKVGQATFYRRRKAGQDLRECLGLNRVTSPKTYRVDGREFATLKEVALAYDMPLGLLQSRAARLGLDEAIHGHVGRTGRYSRRRFRANPQLAASAATVYLIQVTTPEGVLHKIGITRQTVRSRMSNHKHSLIAAYHGRLADVYEVEQGLLKRFEANRYKASVAFAGRTETLLLLAHELETLQSHLAEVAKRFGCRKGRHV
jgi:hypothetical protein